MALYPKKLRSFEDLEREKKLLKKEMARLDEDDTLSLSGLAGKLGKKKDKGEEGGGFSFIDMLPISSPVMMGLVKLVMDRFVNRKSKKAYNDEDAKPNTHPIRNAAVEVLGGYLKWKAAELSFKGVKYLIQRRKEKKAYEASLKFPSEQIK